MISEKDRANFDELVRAAKNDDLAIVECRDKKTGEARLVLCAISSDGEIAEIVPYGHLCTGDPSTEYEPPEIVECHGCKTGPAWPTRQ